MKILRQKMYGCFGDAMGDQWQNTKAFYGNLAHGNFKDAFKAGAEYSKNKTRMMFGQKTQVVQPQQITQGGY